MQAAGYTAEVQNSTFFHTPDNRTLHNRGRIWYVGRPDTDLSCHLPIYTFCYTMWSQSTNITVRQTDRRDAFSISSTSYAIKQHVTIKETVHTTRWRAIL